MLLYGFSKFSILIGWQAVRKNPYPDSLRGRPSVLWGAWFATGRILASPMPAKILPVANQAPHKTEGLPRRLISGPWSVFSVSGPDVVYLHGGKFLLCKQKKFLLFNFPIACVSTDKTFKQPNCFWLSMHAYRILLPSETDDSRFNSREKHMLTDSVQPYNKPITDLACSVYTVKYQTSVFCILKNLGLIFHSTDVRLGQ